MLWCLGMYMKGRGQIVGFDALFTSVWILGIKLRFQTCVAGQRSILVVFQNCLYPIETDLSLSLKLSSLTRFGDLVFFSSHSFFYLGSGPLTWVLAKSSHQPAPDLLCSWEYLDIVMFLPGPF